MDPFQSTDYNPNIRVFYLYDHDVANLHLAQLGSAPQALGFDLEWKPNFAKGAVENPVALVQLANNDAIFLLQISKMKEFPQKLKEILHNPLVIKAGVSVQADARKLWRDCHVPINNLVELSYIAKSVDNASWKGPYKELVSLARLVAKYQARELPKGKITRSNWEANLDSRQIEYASSDAHAGYLIYKHLESMINPEDPPESVWYSFNYVSGRSIDADGTDWFPKNPKYDPGPPPPPRVPKDTKLTTDQNTTQLPPPPPPNTNAQEDSSRRGSTQQQRRRRKPEAETTARASAAAAATPDQTSGSNVGYYQSTAALAPATPTTTRNLTPHHHHPYEGYRSDRQQLQEDHRDPSSQQGPQRNPRRRNRKRNKGNAIAQRDAAPEYDTLLGGMTSLAVGSNNYNHNRHDPSASNHHPMFSIRLGGITPVDTTANSSTININDTTRNYFSQFSRTRARAPPPNHANSTSYANGYGDQNHDNSSNRQRNH